MIINQKPRIAVSVRGLGQVVSGPNSYMAGFTQELIRQAKDCEVHVYYNSSSSRGLFNGAVEHVIAESNIFLWEHYFLPRQLRRDKISLAIFPKGTIPLRLPCKAIPIMLDLGYFYPDLKAYKRLNTLYMKLAMNYSAKMAAGVFTISEYTRQDVIRFLKAAPEKVFNIYGAASEIYRPVNNTSVLERIRKQYNFTEPFIFFPTNISPRKNFPRLLDAFETIMDKIPHHLYFTGSLAWNTEDVMRRIQGPIAARVHQLGKVPLEDMAAIYTLSAFTVYPSLFEGLGLPVLEAFQCGSPVVASSETSLPEIAGHAALMIDAYSVKSIADGLMRMATDDALRSELAQKGFEQAKLFTWEITVARALRWIESAALLS